MSISWPAIFQSRQVPPGVRVAFSNRAAPTDPAPVLPTDGYLTTEVTAFIKGTSNAVGNQFVPMVFGRAARFRDNQRLAAQSLGELIVPPAGANGYVMGWRPLFKDVPMAGQRYEFSLGVRRVSNVNVLGAALDLCREISKVVSQVVPGLGAAHAMVGPLLDKVEQGVELISKVADFGTNDFEVYTNDSLNYLPSTSYIAYISAPLDGPGLLGQSFHFNDATSRLEIWDGQLYAPYTGSSYMVIRLTVSPESHQRESIRIAAMAELATLLEDPKVSGGQANRLMLRGLLSGVMYAALKAADGQLSAGDMERLETDLTNAIKEAMAAIPTGAAELAWAAGVVKTGVRTTSLTDAEPDPVEDAVIWDPSDLQPLTPNALQAMASRIKAMMETKPSSAQP